MFPVVELQALGQDSHFLQCTNYPVTSMDYLAWIRDALDRKEHLIAEVGAQPQREESKPR